MKIVARGDLRNPLSILNHWEWSWLVGCFGDTLITPTDIDGAVERNGHFLLIETKRPGESIPVGQRIALERLCDTLGRRGVLLVMWGEKDDPTELQLRWNGRWLPKERCDMFSARERIHRWFMWSDGHR